MRTTRFFGLAAALGAVLLLLAACGPGADTDSDLAENSTVEQATTASSTGDVGSDDPPSSGDSAADKPVPTGPAATMYPTMASSFDSDGDGFMTKDELQHAVEMRFGEFEWPAGYVTAPRTLVEPFISQFPDHATHENGAEYTIIGNAHMCAWGYTWLDASRSGNRQTMDQSMDQLITVTLELPTFQLIRADLLEPMFQEAELGSPAKLQQYLDTSCNMNVFTSTPQAINPAIRWSVAA